MKWFKKSADQGYAKAQRKMGEYYHNQKKEKEAIKWFRLATNQGDHEAQKNLVWYYFYGVGIPKDYKMATKWINSASKNNTKHKIDKEFIVNFLKVKDGNAKAQYEVATR